MLEHINALLMGVAAVMTAIAGLLGVRYRRQVARMEQQDNTLAGNFKILTERLESTNNTVTERMDDLQQRLNECELRCLECQREHNAATMDIDILKAKINFLESSQD